MTDCFQQQDKRYYEERHKSLRNHAQRFGFLNLDCSFRINASKGEQVIYDDAVYNKKNKQFGLRGSVFSTPVNLAYLLLQVIEALTAAPDDKGRFYV